ncbi:hypothetical protein AVEN_245455-1 [Araneus ventricosus]|uniref:Uncharacterized protein n=1 Tax=Araneus ventricosus TaxID=182803 RepID=A0A4Y2X9E4_ARAVE|nr:hypothetical protein AVEN_245455-1 [Araneus ventricosus]
MNTWIRSRRISKRGLASLVGTIMAWAFRLPLIERASNGRMWTAAGDGYEDSGLCTRAIAATVIGWRILQTEVISIWIILFGYFSSLESSTSNVNGQWRN